MSGAGVKCTMFVALLLALANIALLAAATAAAAASTASSSSNPNLGRVLTHDESEITELHYTSVHHSAPHFDERRGDWREFPVDVNLSLQAPTLGKNWHLKLTRSGHRVLLDDAQVRTQDGVVDHTPHVQRAYKGVEEHDGRWTRVTFLPDGGMHVSSIGGLRTYGTRIYRVLERNQLITPAPTRTPPLARP